MNMPMYQQLPLCIDSAGHRFHLDTIKQDTAVCQRCGLVRVTPRRFRTGGNS